MSLARLLLTGASRFDPRSLFGNGQVGWAHWYDSPSLYSGGNHPYLYQDSAGTTPVTAVGQTIGLSLDRAYGGMRGANSWNPASVSLSGESSQVSIGVYRIYSSAGALSFVSGGTTVVGRLYEVQFTIDSITTPGAGVMVGDSGAIFTTTGRKTSVWLANLTFAFIKRNAGATDIQISNVSVREIPGTHLIQATSTARPTLSARVNLLLNTATMSTQNVTTVATSYKLSFTGTGTVTLSGTSTDGPLVGTGANDRVSLTFTPTAGTLTLTVSGSVTLADLRTADDAAKNIPAYQRVGATAADHDTDGFPHGQYPDGTDDTQTTTTGGGGTTGFFYCGAITVSGGAGTARTIWSDTGTNTGYRVRVNSSNKLELAAGNGSAYTTVESNETITAPGTYILSAWDDGGVLAVQVNNLPPATTARPAVSAGTSTITSYRDNGAATSYFNGRDYGSVYRQSYPGETAHNRLKAWQARRAGINV